MRDLRRRLRLGKQEFNLCFVDDRAIRRLNSAYRGRNKATDVLSFSWNEAPGGQCKRPRGTAVPAVGTGGTPVPHDWHSGIGNFLGDVVISVETARRQARAEGHSTLNEIRWLILHGILHLLGYDHEHDTGEMTARELALREQLGVAGGLGVEKKGKRQNAKGKRQKLC